MTKTKLLKYFFEVADKRIMIRYLTITLLVLFSSLAQSEIGLYTVDDQSPRPISEMNTILNDFVEKSPDQNILFYIHGRKKHVSDELDRIKEIESRYHLKVVMLHWDSYDTLITRPVANAQTAADSVFESFEAIRRFKSDHLEYFKGHTLNLLCHSMGNLVLKFTVEKYYMEDFNQEKIFNNFVSVGADVPLKGHYKWLSQFNLAEKNNIMMNNRDIVLAFSYVLDLKEKNPFQYKLGLGMDNYAGWRDNVLYKLVPTTNYITLSDVLVMDHGYFLAKSNIMKNIFNKLLNGESFISSDKEGNNFSYKQDRLNKNLFSVSK